MAFMPAGYEDSDDSDSEFDFYSGEPRQQRKVNNNAFQPVERNLEDVLLQAVREGNLPEVKRVLEEDRSLESVCLWCGWPVLLLACNEAQPEIVRFLLEEKRIDVNESFDLKTALMTACESDMDSERVLNVVSQLLEYGAVINCKDRFGSTPLIFATANGHTGVVKLLIDQASLEATDNEGLTALFHAVINGHAEIVQMLLKAGAMTDIINRRGFTPKQEAEFKGLKEIAEMFPADKEFYNIPLKYMSYARYEDITQDDREDELPGYYPEIGLLLFGMYSEQHLGIFAKENFNLLRFLTLDDSQLKELGLVMPFERKRILLGLLKFHERAWKNRSMLKFADRHQLDSYDILQLVGNHLKQLTVMQASLIYATKMLPPAEMQHEFKDQLFRCTGQLRKLQSTVGAFQREMERIHAMTALKPVLHVDAGRFEAPGPRRRLVRTAFKLALLSGAISFVVYLKLRH